MIGFLTVLFFVFTTFSYSHHAKDKTLAEFNEDMQEIGIVFKMPDGFKNIPLVLEKRRLVDYQCVIKHKNKNLEVRYSLYPYTAPVKEPNKVVIGSDSAYKQFTYSFLLAMAGDEEKILKYIEFDKNAVKEDFNADLGNSNFLIPGSLFGEGYELAMGVALYKNGAGHAYITLLFDKYKDIEDVFSPAFHSLSYK